jgi:hypothetical protein
LPPGKKAFFFYYTIFNYKNQIDEQELIFSIFEPVERQLILNRNKIFGVGEKKIAALPFNSFSSPGFVDR